MAKYRKKPVVIEAYQTDKVMYIETLEGTHKANVGDYIITGVHGEQYPCKPDIFEETYERVPDDYKTTVYVNERGIRVQCFAYVAPLTKDHRGKCSILTDWYNADNQNALCKDCPFYKPRSL